MPDKYKIIYQTADAGIEPPLTSKMIIIILLALSVIFGTFFLYGYVSDKEAAQDAAIIADYCSSVGHSETLCNPPSQKH